MFYIEYDFSKKINKCYTVLYNVCYFKDSDLLENTDKRIGIEDKSCPCTAVGRFGQIIPSHTMYGGILFSSSL